MWDTRFVFVSYIMKEPCLTLLRGFTPVGAWIVGLSPICLRPFVPLLERKLLPSNVRASYPSSFALLCAPTCTLGQSLTARTYPSDAFWTSHILQEWDFFPFSLAVYTPYSKVVSYSCVCDYLLNSLLHLLRLIVLLDPKLWAPAPLLCGSIAPSRVLW